MRGVLSAALGLQLALSVWPRNSLRLAEAATTVHPPAEETAAFAAWRSQRVDGGRSAGADRAAFTVNWRAVQAHNRRRVHAY